MIVPLTAALGLVGVYSYLPSVEISENISEGNNTKIGLIADTHVPGRASKIPERVFEIFRKAEVDHIVHAGDITDEEAIQELEEIAPVTAVHGNMDTGEAREIHPGINSIEIEGRKIGVFHNSYLLGRKQKALEVAKDHNFDIIVVGHTHKQELFKKEDFLIVNPGSPTNPLPPFLVKPTVAILELGEKPKIKFLSVT